MMSTPVVKPQPTFSTVIGIFTLMIWMNSCIGTDVLDIELFDPEVKIVSQVISMEVDTDFQFMAIYLNEFAMEEAANLVWSSSDEAVISIDADGLAHAEMMGTATITVTFETLSDQIDVIVNMEETNEGDRVGTFQGLGGYHVAGDFSLNVDGDDLILNFKSNFSSSSGPGLYVYMTNSTSSVAGGVELGPLQSTIGAQSYTVPSGVMLGTYDYVLIYCKPFSVPFGLGTFE